MNRDEEIKQRLAEYEEAYDFYMEQGSMPESMESGDMLGEYMERIIRENPGMTECDETWKEVVKEEMMTFIEVMLKAFVPLEEEHQRQVKLIEVYRAATVEKKRELWPEIYEVIKENYAKEEVNIDAYARQFGGVFRESVAGALTNDWKRANDSLLERGKRECLERGMAIMENNVIQCGNSDYEQRMDLEEKYYHYPQLQEIVRMIGRKIPQNPEIKDDITYRYIPLLPGAQVEHIDVEMIAASNDIRSMIPSEMAIMADRETESLFYMKYASRQLQTFANKPLVKGQKKTVVRQVRQQRLLEGPIIVALDTSYSMHGKPETIARSLLMQLLRIARKQKRRCFLITFSVRAKSLDLCSMHGWKEVNGFLQSGFSGGTDGEEMLNRALEQLAGERYEMADVLVISDFQFPLPLAGTLKKMNDEKAKGVCFYGLKIGRRENDYFKVMDKIWEV